MTVRDANACTTLVGPQITITQPAQLTLTQSQVNNVCFGGSIGSINISASGGTAPYTFAWTGPDGFVSGIKLIRTSLSDATGSKRRSPVAIKGSQLILDVDQEQIK